MDLDGFSCLSFSQLVYDDTCAPRGMLADTQAHSKSPPLALIIHRETQQVPPAFVVRPHGVRRLAGQVRLAAAEAPQSCWTLNRPRACCLHLRMLPTCVTLPIWGFLARHEKALFAGSVVVEPGRGGGRRGSRPADCPWAEEVVVMRLFMMLVAPLVFARSQHFLLFGLAVIVQ